MKKVRIEYKNGRPTVEFTTDKVFYHTQYGLREIGYLREDEKRKRWYPIDGRDYENTEVIIEEV